MVDDVSKAMLRKLFYDNRIGKKHISLENLKTGFPSHLKGDVDSFLAGVCESLQAAKENAPLNLVFSCRPDLNPSISLIIEDDSLVVTSMAKKIEDKTEYYTVLVEPV